ncbi:MAG: hypothetical protein IKU73_05780 [Clostridia bacterium]|nr:hypothetical protein [Clostridia bacterium]
MGRFFSAVLLCAVLLLPARRDAAPVQPVFFSMLFPQLIPPSMLHIPQHEAATPGEAVLL